MQVLDKLNCFVSNTPTMTKCNQTANLHIFFGILVLIHDSRLVSFPDKNQQ